MNKKEIIEYFKSNDFDIQNANASPFVMDLVYTDYAKSDDVTGVDVCPIISFYSYKRKNFFLFHQVLNIKKIEQINHLVYLNYLKDRKTLADKIERHLELEKELDVIWQQYQVKKDVKLFENLVKVAKKWWHYGIIGEDKGEVVGKEVVPRFALRNKIDANEARMIINILSHPDDPSPMTLERKRFLEICLDIIDKINPAKKIRDYIGNYFWMDTDFFMQRDVTEETLLKKVSSYINGHSRTEIIAEIKEIDINFQKICDKKKKLEAETKLSSEDEIDILFAKSIVKWMDARKTAMMKQAYYLFYFLAAIAKKYKLDYNDLSCYFVDEVIQLVKTGKKVPKAEIKERFKDSFLVFEKNKKKRFFGKDYQDFLNEIEKKHQNTSVITGSVASMGKEKTVSGRVAIVLDPVKDKFSDGDVLVTSMTRVEFVPLMRRAKAIITNEGGIACHAAIVSRELGVPCIIGTKIATKFLKTGDIVELRLDEGTVKIIK